MTSVTSPSAFTSSAAANLPKLCSHTLLVFPVSFNGDIPAGSENHVIGSSIVGPGGVPSWLAPTIAVLAVATASGILTIVRHTIWARYPPINASHHTPAPSTTAFP